MSWLIDLSDDLRLLSPYALEREFFHRARRFGHRDGFVGSHTTTTDGQRVTRGRGYAVVYEDAHAIFLLPRRDRLRRMVERACGAAIELGAELEQRLRGLGEERDFGDAAEEARRTGLGLAINGVTPAPVDRDWYFYHLRPLPHLRSDDGTAVFRDAECDGLQMVIRFFGAPVPL